MNNSRSFDQAADIYDQTRPLFDIVAQKGIQAILDIIGSPARILEVGAGTGRISIPLLDRGANMVGCDLSAKMLARQLYKFPAARLAQADAAYLPFPTDQFDALLTVHVMHLVGPWREALHEFKRVLKTGGVYLNVRTYETVGTSIRANVRAYWHNWLEAHEVDSRHPGIQSNEDVPGKLQSMGARLEQVEAIRYPLTYTLRAELDRFQNRVYSDTWSIPDKLYQASLEELQSWITHEYGDLEQEREDTVRFVFDAAYFDN